MVRNIVLVSFWFNRLRIRKFIHKDKYRLIKTHRSHFSENADKESESSSSEDEEDVTDGAQCGSSTEIPQYLQQSSRFFFLRTSDSKHVYSAYKRYFLPENFVNKFFFANF